MIKHYDKEIESIELKNQIINSENEIQKNLNILSDSILNLELDIKHDIFIFNKNKNCLVKLSDFLKETQLFDHNVKQVISNFHQCFHKSLENIKIMSKLKQKTNHYSKLLDNITNKKPIQNTTTHLIAKYLK